ncbi:lipoprotein-anchoring transpeptidase ErfK/SrfK [Rhodoligotrophos appendicifer]|uniref:L,D-transpeptidase n=1 Tax=Rhodoligotrophos appendicifer TaxID=987056 RepID=UPI00117C4CC6|nr:L,D-transpeptidase [Rhodoligotrophos appendicifer]
MIRGLCAAFLCALVVTVAFWSSGASAQSVRFNFNTESRGLDKKFQKQMVAYNGREAPGTIIIDTKNRFLFLVMPGGQAMRYGVGVGRDGFAWSGEATIESKQEWPKWFPPKEMIARDPKLAPYSTGMAGGPENPLGARAMYLYKDGKDTLFRIHGTSQPWSIGQSLSSGCIRLLNEDVIDLYERVNLGTTVVVQ